MIIQKKYPTTSVHRLIIIIPSPKQIADLIFSQDEDIRKWLSNWVNDLLNHEHNKTIAMEKIRDEIGLKQNR